MREITKEGNAGQCTRSQDALRTEGSVGQGPKAGLRLEGMLGRDRERTGWRESKVVGKVVEGRGEAVEEGGPYIMIHGGGRIGASDRL